MILQKTYKMEMPPEAAMRWDSYEQIVSSEWHKILNDTPVSGEADVQAFLERHPVMVPGAFTVLGSPSGHYPWLSALISQAVLPSYKHRVPDFMWLTLNSDTESPVLIEIEAPEKRWFTAGGTPTAQLTQALDQIAEWKAWFAVSHNVEAFRAFYGLDAEALYRRRFRPSYLLIYGRRSEASARPALTAKRSHLFPEDVVGMTYDRLWPDQNASQLICIKARAAGEFTAVSVPPTLEWSPVHAEDRSQIIGFGSVGNFVCEPVNESLAQHESIFELDGQLRLGSMP